MRDEADQRECWESALAAELAHLAAETQALGEALSDDPNVVEHHAVTLQRIDGLAQLLWSIGRIVGADDRDAALAECPNGGLAERITHWRSGDASIASGSRRGTSAGARSAAC